MVAWLSWKTLQQVIRIIGFALAGVAFGIGWIDQNTFLQIVSGGGFLSLFTWWAAFNQTIKKK